VVAEVLHDGALLHVFVGLDDGDVLVVMEPVKMRVGTVWVCDMERLRAMVSLFEKNVLSTPDTVIVRVNGASVVDSVRAITLEIETEADGDESLYHRRQIQKEYINVDVSAAPSFQPTLRPLMNVSPNCSSATVLGSPCAQKQVPGLTHVPLR
jgi:hypothetical protein